MSPVAVGRLTSNGVALRTGQDALGELASLDAASATPELLRARMADEGYFLARGLLAAEPVASARHAVLQELRRRGTLAPDAPAEEARPNGRLAGKRVMPELGALPEVRALLREAPLVDTFARLLGGTPRMLDHVWLRMVPPGHSTTPHCDIVYMGRGTHRLCTAWIALADVPRTSGALMLLERSHLIESLRERYWNLDVDRDRLWGRIRFRHWKVVSEGKYSHNPHGVQREFGRRWLTTDFRAGDVLVFSPFVMHASLDNVSDRVRVTVDARWQLAAEPADERWIGEHPPGHGRPPGRECPPGRG